MHTTIDPRPSAHALFKAALYFNAVGDPDIREHVLSALLAEPRSLFARMLATHAYYPHRAPRDRGAS